MDCVVVPITSRVTEGGPGMDGRTGTRRRRTADSGTCEAAGHSTAARPAPGRPGRSRGRGRPAPRGRLAWRTRCCPGTPTAPGWPPWPARSVRPPGRWSPRSPSECTTAGAQTRCEVPRGDPGGVNHGAQGEKKTVASVRRSPGGAGPGAVAHPDGHDGAGARRAAGPGARRMAAPARTDGKTGSAVSWAAARG